MPSIWAEDLDAHRRLVAERLLDAYEHQRRIVGVNGVTISAVAAEAGLARSAVYNYFTNKHDLIISHAERTFIRAATAIRAEISLTDEPGAALRAYIVHVLRNMDYGAGDGMMPVLTPEEARRMRTMLRPLRELLAEIIETGVADGTFHGDADQAVGFVWAMVAGYRITLAAGQREPGNDIQYATDTILHGLTHRQTQD